jgi:hypothetical protein
LWSLGVERRKQRNCYVYVLPSDAWPTIKDSSPR